MLLSLLSRFSPIKYKLMNAIAGYSDLSSLASLIVPTTSSTLSIQHQQILHYLTIFAPVTAFERFASNTALTSLNATTGKKTLLQLAIANYILLNTSANSTVILRISSLIPCLPPPPPRLQLRKRPRFNVGGVEYYGSGIVRNGSISLFL